MNKTEFKRYRIYKLSTFDTLTDEERALNESYKKVGNKNEKERLKDIRDNKIASYNGVRKIDGSKLYSYVKDENGNVVKKNERTDKQIALFESEMARYSDEFSGEFPLIKDIVYMKVDHQNVILKQIIDRGLDIDGIHYVFYGSTTNQMKRGEIILLNEKFYDAHKYQFMCGLTDKTINSKGGCNRGKYLAYKGLPLSSSFVPEGYKIDIDKCLVVPDFKTTLNEMVECIDIDHGQKIITGIEKRYENVEIPQTDGAGIFLPEVLPASAQIRCGHLKGCIFPFDFRKFLALDEVEGVKPSPVIKDAWGDTHDVIKEDIQVIFTASQLKMWKYYSSWDEFKECFRNGDMHIAINKFAEDPKGTAKTSYQFLQTLSPEKLTDGEIKKLCAPTMAYLEKMKNNADAIIEPMGKSYLTDAIRLYPELIYSKFVGKEMEGKFRSECTDAKGGKLILEDSLYSYICPDLYAFATWLFCGVASPKGIIPRDYVYNKFFDFKGYDTVDCLRSPHLYIEHGIRKLVKGEMLGQCKEWFGGCDTAVSSHDLLCRILNFDVDGDEILLTPNPTIISCVPDNVTTLYYRPFAAETHIISSDTLYDALVASIDNSNIGDISNVMTKNYNNQDTDAEFNKVMTCYNNLTIDFPKTQKNILLGKYQDKYDELLGEKAPYFFKYAKGKPKYKEAGNSNVDRICQYIHKGTCNKNYAWKLNKKRFDPSILIDSSIKIDVKSKKYEILENLMFNLKQEEQDLKRSIDKVINCMSRSGGKEVKHDKWDIFYYICKNRIMELFNTEKEAAAYLLDFEYLQRGNEDRGKNILWNCFGNIICDNIGKNLEIGGYKKRKYHIYKEPEIKEIAEKTVNVLKDTDDRKIGITVGELEWVDNVKYKKGCTHDMELLYIILFLYKIHGKAFKLTAKKNGMTYNKIDRWLGDGICVAKKGIQRLADDKIITIEKDGRDIKVGIREDILAGLNGNVAFEVCVKDNPLIPFYMNNGKRKIGECKICKKNYIKIGNMLTCSPKCSKELELRRKRADKS